MRLVSIKRFFINIVQRGVHVARLAIFFVIPKFYQCVRHFHSVLFLRLKHQSCRVMIGDWPVLSYASLIFDYAIKIDAKFNIGQFNDFFLLISV